MKKIRLYDALDVEISDDDWDFLCNVRFFTDTPTYDEIETEFLAGTFITENKKHLGDVASSKFAEYIADLRSMNPLIHNPGNGIKEQIAYSVGGRTIYLSRAVVKKYEEYVCPLHKEFLEVQVKLFGEERNNKELFELLEKDMWYELSGYGISVD